jgi:hypothetical protein
MTRGTVSPSRYSVSALQELSLVGILRLETLEAIEDLPALRTLYIWRSAVPDAEWLRFNRHRQEKKLPPVDM